MSATAARVPLAVDAAVRVRAGPAVLPLRSLLLSAAISPLAYLILAAGLPGFWGPGGALFLLALAALGGTPEAEGIWLGTYLLYRQAWRLLPNAVVAGAPRRARVTLLADGVVRISNPRPVLVPPGRAPLALARLLGPPSRVLGAGDGLLELEHAGPAAVLCLEGPPVSPASEAYLQWCLRAVAWATAQQCPAQFVTAMAHHDGERVGAAFDARVAGWPSTPLRSMERALVLGLADRTLGLRHFVVLAPGSAGPDGVPYASAPWRACPRATRAWADKALQSALRTASAFALHATAADRDDMGLLLAGSALGTHDLYAGGGVLHAGGQHRQVLVATALPASVESGCVVEAMLQARAAGSVSLHLIPVSRSVAQRQLQRRAAMLRYAAAKGADSVEAEVALHDTGEATAALAARQLVPVRLALTVAVAHHDRCEATAAAERCAVSLAAQGFRVVGASGPGLLPLLAAGPAGAPLRRSLILTTAAVAARMLPCLGTPFGDIGAPLLGVNLVTGAPTHLSVWRQANHNLVIVGSSGAGKSVAAKALLVRHIMEGAVAAVIDPDSEYGPVMRCVGGAYHELGDDAVNPLAPAATHSPDDAAGMVLPVLSVMAGDERGTAERRPIRRLADEDQGWLHSQLVDFFRGATASCRGREPVVSDLVHHLDAAADDPSWSDRERVRSRVITARLRRFTQGPRGRVFDRPSTFAVGERSVAVGMRHFAMTYGADLTPALAVLLTALLAAVEQRRGRLLVVVDEAHRVTSDPDAGEVLGQLVRQARKHGAGVWMLSQRVDDFVNTDLGRTLAATSASKLILGTEEALAADVRTVFKLSAEEEAAVSPMRTGCGVAIAGHERALVRLVPGEAILAVAGTTMVALSPPPGAERRS